MAAILRQDFLPADQRRFAGQNRPLPIGEGQTNSQPQTVQAMLELLAVRPGDRVLDVGAGSGWATALLGYLVGSSGSVTGVELEESLASWGARNVAAYEMPWVHLHRAVDGVLGWPTGAPYDRILVSAAAGEIPGELVRQLASAGRMVIPVHGVMRVVLPDGQGGWTSTAHGAYRFVPLR